MGVAVNVLLPQEGDWRTGIPQTRYKTLWLLHGLSDDQNSWMRWTAIERYVNEYALAVVMPAVNRSFYADMVSGPAYWTYVSEELPAIMRAWFPLSDARADNYVAGLSMGGFGALKLAFNYPDRFAAVAALSASVRRLGGPLMPYAVRDYELIYGDVQNAVGSNSDLYAMAEKVAALPAQQQPRIYQWCGTEDILYPANIALRDHMRGLGLNLLYEEGPGGHTWDHWDRALERILPWLDLPALYWPTE